MRSSYCGRYHQGDHGTAVTLEDAASHKAGGGIQERNNREKERLFLGLHCKWPFHAKAIKEQPVLGAILQLEKRLSGFVRESQCLLCPDRLPSRDSILQAETHQLNRSRIMLF